MKEEIEKARKILEESDIPTDYLEETFQRHYEVKKEIHALCKLDESNNFKLSIPLTKSLDNCPEIKNLIQSAIEGEPEYTLLDLTFLKHGKQIVKITKYFNNNYERLIQNSDFRYYARIAGYQTPLTIETKQAFLIWYGEKSVNGRTGIISGTALDILTASYNAAFCSCIRPDGEYFNTVLSYLASENVLVSYITDNLHANDYKIGRQLIFITPSQIAQLRCYGTFLDEDSRLIRLKLQEIIGGKWIKRSEALRTCDVNYRGDGYIDYGYGVFSYLEETERRQFEIKKGNCLSCNNTLDRADKGVCSNCQEDYYTCAACETRIDSDHVMSDQSGDTYCRDCYYERYFNCDRCEHESSIDEQFTVEGDSLCLNCYENNALECESCNESFYTENMIECNDVWYCQTCAADELTECEECQEVVKNDETQDINGLTLCESCAADYLECSECQDMIKKEDSREAEGKIYCNSCFETAPLNFEERATLCT